MVTGDRQSALLIRRKAADYALGSVCLLNWLAVRPTLCEFPLLPLPTIPIIKRSGLSGMDGERELSQAATTAAI